VNTDLVNGSDWHLLAECTIVELRVSFLKISLLTQVSMIILSHPTLRVEFVNKFQLLYSVGEFLNRN